MNVRTDLACELHDAAMKKYAKENKGVPDGIIEKRRDVGGGINICEIDITSDDGARLIGKPQGKYVTVSFPPVRDMDCDLLGRISDAVAAELKTFAFSDGRRTESVMFCGLGNRLLAADAIGPLSADKILVTRHIKRSSPEIYAKSGLFDVCALAPGVAAQTGMEALDVVKSAVETERPDVLVVCDALAARETERLSSTVQISNSGITPGSGVGGYHTEISTQTVGIPVISVGVPTVIDSSTLVCDALERAGAGGDLISAATETTGGLFVSPKDIDVLAKNLGLLIACAFNRAFHGEIPYEEMILM